MLPNGMPETPKPEQIIEQLQQAVTCLQVENSVLNQTLGEVMSANIQLRTGMILIEDKSKQLAQSIIEKDKEIASLNDKLTVANAVIQKSTNLVPASEDSIENVAE